MFAPPRGLDAVVRPGQSRTVSAVVDCRAGSAGAAAGEGPAEHSGFRHLHLPVWCLLGAVMRTARSMQVALVRRSLRVGRDVVLVGVEGLAAAAGAGTGLGSGKD